jgi:hypothetical protein
VRQAAVNLVEGGTRQEAAEKAVAAAVRPTLGKVKAMLAGRDVTLRMQRGADGVWEWR